MPSTVTLAIAMHASGEIVMVELPPHATDVAPFRLGKPLFFRSGILRRIAIFFLRKISCGHLRMFLRETLDHVWMLKKLHIRVPRIPPIVSLNHTGCAPSGVHGEPLERPRIGTRIFKSRRASRPRGCCRVPQVAGKSPVFTGVPILLFRPGEFRRRHDARGENFPPATARRECRASAAPSP